MSNTLLSPSEPLFFLHHTWLDKIWWQWQSQQPNTRLTEIGGLNLPSGGPPSPSGNGTATAVALTSPNGNGACLPPLGGGSGAAIGHGAGKALNKAITDYFGDGSGEVTTLGHVLWSAGILPNATVGEVMDLGGGVVCAEYGR